MLVYCQAFEAWSSLVAVLVVEVLVVVVLVVAADIFSPKVQGDKLHFRRQDATMVVLVLLQVLGISNPSRMTISAIAGCNYDVLVLLQVLSTCALT